MPRVGVHTGIGTPKLLQAFDISLRGQAVTTRPVIVETEMGSNYPTSRGETFFQAQQSENAGEAVVIVSKRASEEDRYRLRKDVEASMLLAKVKKEIQPHMQYFEKLSLNDKEVFIRLMQDPTKNDSNLSPNANILSLQKNFEKLKIQMKY